MVKDNANLSPLSNLSLHGFNVLFHPLGAVLVLLDKLCSTGLVLQLGLHLLNVLDVKLVLLECLQFVICIVLKSFQYLDLCA